VHLLARKEPSTLEGSRVRVAFGAGRSADLASYVAAEGGSRVLLVTDPGLVTAGHVEKAVSLLTVAGITVAVFDGVEENPTSLHVEAGVQTAREEDVDLLLGLGGGSSLDVTKGIAFILSNGGTMRDYRGRNRAPRPFLPMIGVPTTAGTGSEAQSYALISDPLTREKMACGDDKAYFRIAVLDPDLLATVPRGVSAAAGLDALSHAVEASATRTRTPQSRAIAREAWTMLERSFEALLDGPKEPRVLEDMLVGSHLAGVAIECSMLGAAHACANPLTARCNLVHGVAVSVMLPWVVRFNAEGGADPYADLMPAGELTRRIESFLDAAGVARRLSQHGVDRDLLPSLAADAATQWTGKHNPREVGERELLSIYQAAY